MASTKAGTASTKAVSERKLKYWTRKLRTQLNDVRDAVGDDGLLTVIKQSLRKEELPKFAALAAQPIEKGIEKGDKMKAQVAERLADSSRAFLALLGWKAAPKALDLDGASRPRSFAKVGSTHDGPGTGTRSPRDQYWSLTK